MKLQFWRAPFALGLAVVFLGPVVEGSYARGRGGGGFSRESPAASGGLSSRSGSTQERRGGAQASRQQYGSSAQASRQQYGSSAQASRKQTATSMQSSREQTATGMQSSAQRYRGSYPYGASASTNWDAGAGLAAATTGAAIGAAAASSMHPTTTAYATAAPGQPCANPMVVPAGGMNYFKCGSAWYTQAFGPSGPMFVHVAPPPGF